MNFMKYTIDQLRQIASTSSTLKEIFQKLGYKGRSLDRLTRQKILSEAAKNNIDLSHLEVFAAQEGRGNKKFTLKELLTKDTPYRGGNQNLKVRLFRAKLLTNECSICRIASWQGKAITLQLDHINGVYNDNRLENLRILCPNCHSQTDTYAGRNTKVRAKPKATCACGNSMKTTSKICKKCQDSNKETFPWPPDEELFQMVREKGVKLTAKACGLPFASNLIHRLGQKGFDYKPYYNPKRGAPDLG